MLALTHMHAHTKTHTDAHTLLHVHAHTKTAPLVRFISHYSTFTTRPTCERRPSSPHQSSPSLPPSLGSLLCPRSSRRCSVCQDWTAGSWRITSVTHTHTHTFHTGCTVTEGGLWCNVCVCGVYVCECVFGGSCVSENGGVKPPPPPFCFRPSGVDPQLV